LAQPQAGIDSALALYKDKKMLHRDARIALLKFVVAFVARRICVYNCSNAGVR
jgi:hypothetical protein